MQNTIILLSGLVCSGKSSLAKLLYERLLRDNKKVSLINGDEYIQKNFPKENFVFDKENRIKLDKIISQDIHSQKMDGRYFIVDLGSIYEEGRNLYQFDDINTVLVYINTPLFICIFREIVRSFKGKSPIKNWIYFKAIKSKLFNEKNKNLIQGITLPYEVPSNPQLKIDLSKTSLNDVVEKIISLLE